MNTRYLVVIVSAALICPEAMYGRTWTDASGKHQIEAELLGFRDGLVHLKKPDGTVLNIALDKLCPSDQAFVRQSAITSGTSPPGKPPAELRVDLGSGLALELVLIPAGEFMMGSPDSEPTANCEDEKPLHKVQITQPFYLGKFEVTQEQWQAVTGYNPSNLPGPKNPVDSVSWEECQIFLHKLNAKSAAAGGVKFHLPTEAQWEYACRAGSTTRWSWGDDPAQIGEYAVGAGNSPRGSAPVGQKKPNAWGLYDLHGNVWEWCADWCATDYYAQSPAQDPTGPTSPVSVFGREPSPVFRGGSWFNRRPEELRCAQRGVRCESAGIIPSDYPWNGFRVAGSLGTSPAPGTQAGAAPDGPGAALEVIRFSYHVQRALPFLVDSVAADGSVQICPNWEMWKYGRQQTLLRSFTLDMLYAALGKARGCSVLGCNGLPGQEGTVMQSNDLVTQPLDDLRIFRVQVLDVLEDGKPAVSLRPAAKQSKIGELRAVIRLAPEAAKRLKAGDQLFLFWPAGATLAQLQAVPDMLPLVDVRDGAEDAAQRPSAGLKESLNNLRNIGVALHCFHDVYKHLPPAVVYGPDGQPWHSWRVLILPFIDQRALYERYRFDEPWDGPNNKALLASIPPVYRDPVYPDAKDACTHYAAITGPGTAFPLEPRKPVTFLKSPAGLSAASAGMADIRDGTANTLLVGSVSPDRKIPWMKPEDVTWSDNFPGLGKPSGFAAPHKVGQFAAGVFARVDGSATAIRDNIDPADWRRLLQVADGQRLGEIPEFPSDAAGARRPAGTPLLEIPINQPGASARLLIVPYVHPPVNARQQSLINFRQIGLAMHNFHDVYKQFPPAVVYGPDGKPWHSWRVLILPFVEQQALYDRYRFDEPWDGPNNKALLESVPPVYRDPVYPVSKDAFTHCAAITGPGTAFPLEPRNPVNFMPKPAGLSAATTRMADIRDGTASTILVGPVTPERKIPWTKPEDVTWNDNFPDLGQLGSFATPHKLDNRPAAVFLRADGSVSTERANLDRAELRMLFQVADAQGTDPSKAPPGDVPPAKDQANKAAAAGQPSMPGEPVQYQPFFPDKWVEKNTVTRLFPWEGRQVVLLTTAKDFDPQVMTVILERLDAGWETYARIIGHQPRIGREYRGKTTVAAAPSTHELGGAFGLGVGGITGVEVAGFYDHDYPLVAKQPRAFPHYFFYEFGRNYFLFGDRHSLFATGFAVAMRYVCMDATGCEDADIKTRQWIERFESQFAGSQVPFGQAFVQFGAKNNIQLRDIDGSPFEYSDLTILYASIVLKLRKEHGGDDWTTRFYEHIYDCLPSAPATPEGATGQLVNWVVSSSLAARKDLTPLFVERWRFPISPELQRALAAVDWAKKDVTARAVFESLPTGVLPGRLAVRLPAFLTAERKQQNLLTDGSFETAAGNDWSASTWRNNPQAVTRVDGGREGQRAVQIRTTVADDVQYRQRVSVKPQTRYLLSGWIKTQGVQIVEKGGSQGANLSLDGTWEATAPVLGDTDWTYVTLEFDSGPRTEVAVAARLGFFYSTATGTAWYDDLCLIEIDRQNSRGDKPEAARATALGDKAAGRGVKLLGMTVVDPTQELLHQYGLPEQYPGPIIVQQMDRSPYWASFGSPPGEGCAFWLIQDPGHQFLFNQKRSPSYTPKTVRELTTAILACAASPDEYQKMWDAMRQQCRENAEKVKDNPEQRERILKAAEATMPKEDVGKHICRVVYHFPKGEGTMTTYLRLGKEDVEQLRALLNSPFSGKPK